MLREGSTQIESLEMYECFILKGSNGTANDNANGGDATLLLRGDFSNIPWNCKQVQILILERYYTDTY